jgi:transcriptional regulator with XRE-family HTH domain
MTPLKQVRVKRRWTLSDVLKRLAQKGVQLDTGNLSRIERGAQRASAPLAESLCRVFDNEITEIHILYPERFQGSGVAAVRADSPPEQLTLLESPRIAS